MREFLWAGRNCDLRYVGDDGNIRLLVNQQGTFSCWVNSAIYTTTLHGYQSILVAHLNANNSMIFFVKRHSYGTQALSFTLTGNGTSRNSDYTIDDAIFPIDRWHHVVCTWDFTGAPGAGVLHMYLNGAPVGSAVSNAVAFTAAPATIYVGENQVSAGSGFAGFMDNAAIWNKALTAGEVATLYAAGRRHLPIAADGAAATLLLRLPFNGSYDADVAAGTATATATTGVARIPDGTICTDENGRAQRASFHFGTGTDRARIPGEAIISPYAYGTTPPFPVDSAGYTTLVLAAGEVHGYFFRRAAIDPTWLPRITKFRFKITGLTNDYISIGDEGSAHIRIYNDRITSEVAPTTELVRPIQSDALDGWAGTIRWVNFWLVELDNEVSATCWAIADGSSQMGHFTVVNFLAGRMVLSAAHAANPITVKVESIEVYGPTQYQTNDQPRDDFLMSEYQGTEADMTGKPVGKVWSADGLVRSYCTPTKHAGNPVVLQSGLSFGVGTLKPLDVAGAYYSHDGTHHLWLTAQPAGSDYGFYKLDSVDGITWTEDSTNPQINATHMIGPAGEWDAETGWPFRFHPPLVGPENEVVVPYNCDLGNDGNQIGLVIGTVGQALQTLAPADKYPQNPVLRCSWVDGLLNNHDLYPLAVANEFPVDPDGRDAYISIGTSYSFWKVWPKVLSFRGLVCWQSRNLRSWESMCGIESPFPGWGPTETYLPGQVAHDSWVCMAQGLSPGGLPDGPWMIATEDRILWQLVSRPMFPIATQAWELAGSANYGVGPMLIRVGDNWHCYYTAAMTADHGIGLLVYGYGRLVQYALDAGETDRILPTCGFVRPIVGWGPFILNADTADGAITVALQDPDTGLELAGWGAADMDAWTGNHVEQEVTWAGKSLYQLATTAVRFVFRLTRPAAGDDTPIIYSYCGLMPQATTYPAASALQVEAQTEPARVYDPQPTFSWTFTGAAGHTQAEARFVLASTAEAIRELLEGGSPTVLYDTGWAALTTPSFDYGVTPGFSLGPLLFSYELYAWTILVRDNLGQEQPVANGQVATFGTGGAGPIAQYLLGGAGAHPPTAPIHLVRDKEEVPLLFHLVEADGVTPIVLTSATDIRFAMWREGSTVLTASGPCVIADILNGDVQYDWNVGELATLGRYHGQVVVTWQDGRDEGFPARRAQEFRIRESIEP